MIKDTDTWHLELIENENFVRLSTVNAYFFLYWLDICDNYDMQMENFEEQKAECGAGAATRMIHLWLNHKQTLWLLLITSVPRWAWS